jgi:CheY-like chemotaxis protein
VFCYVVESNDIYVSPGLCMNPQWIGGSMAPAVVVDDSRLMRRMIRTVLETTGYTVVCEAKSGEQAVQQYLEYYPQIVTMDITMPWNG